MLARQLADAVQAAHDLDERIEGLAAAHKRLQGRFYAALRDDRLRERDPTPLTDQDALDAAAEEFIEQSAQARRDELRRELLPKTPEGRIAVMKGKAR